MTVAFLDWNRLRARIGELAVFERSAAGLGWATFGAGISAFLVLIPWLPASSQLDSSAHMSFAWVAPALIILGLAAFTVAGVCWWETKGRHDNMKRGTRHLQENMDDLSSKYQASLTQLPAASTPTAEPPTP
jgi:hypothetical protein